MKRQTFFLSVLCVSLVIHACNGAETPLSDAALPDVMLFEDAGPPPSERLGRFIVHGDAFYQWVDDGYRRFFVRGVDLGVGMPGTQPGDLAPSYDDYMRWFGQMKEAGFDAVRIYTLHYPRFHRAVRDYNAAHSDDPLWILQGVWLSESNPSGTEDLHGLTDDFGNLIEETIDAAHGNRVIMERRGRAWGTYDVDISEWVMGYIVGREIYGAEVSYTDMVHAEDVAYEGESVRLASGNPSSVWAAQMLDRALSYEWNQYALRTPMAFANWMETDPLSHPTEPSWTRKDIGTIDLRDLETFGAPQGHFFSFHVYPYFPRFITEQPSYQRYSDEYGNNSYRGYLEDLKQYHRGRALMVTEFGVPSSWGRAQDTSNGMHHGGHTEADQGRFVARMLGDIVETNYAGAICFHWMDGWFKRIWITREITFPAERLRLWHDMMNAQQHYGLVAFALPEPDFGDAPVASGSGAVRELRAVADAEFFHTELTLSRPLANGEVLWLGYDTYADARGESRFPNDTESARRIEFALRIGEDDEAQLHVMASYDLYTIFGASGPSTEFRSTRSDGGEWRPMMWNLTGARSSDDGRYQFDPVNWEAGRLHIRRSGEEASSHDAVVIEETRIQVRVPWTLLAFSDPSSRRVIDDDPSTDGTRETAETEGIALVVRVGEETLSSERIGWPLWNRAPETTERFKASMPLIRDALAEIAAFPDE